MTPLHHQVKSALLPICLAETVAQREKISTTNEDGKRLRAIVERAQREQDISTRYAEMFGKIIADFHGFKYKEDEGEILEPGTVVFVERNTCHHNYEVGKLYLVFDGKAGECLHEEGNENNLTAQSSERKDWRLATDEEVEKCLDELNSAQLRQLLSLEVFEAALAPLFEAQTELVPEDKVGEDDIVVEKSDGDILF